MRECWNALIAVLLAGQIAVQASPESESARKGVKLLCGLAVLLTLLSPIRHLPEAASEIWRTAEELLAAKEEIPSDPYAQTAQAILAYAAETADVDQMELTLVEDEAGEVREMQLFLPSCSEAARAEIEKTIEEAYKIPVFIFTQPGADDGQKLE